MQLTIHAPSILLCTKPVDFRKAINGLLDIVLSDLNIDPRINIFIFYNRCRDKIKVLAWHKNGFVLLLKRLEKGQFFNVTEIESNTINVTAQQLSWLMAGLNWVAMTEWGELEYRDFH
jgi:transposase